MTPAHELEREAKLRVEAAEARERLVAAGSNLVAERHLEENWVLDTPSRRLQAGDRLLQENRKRVEVGAMAPLEEKSAEAQAAASRASLIAAQGNYGTRMRILKNLLTDDYSPLRDLEIIPTEDLAAIPVRPQVQDSWLKGLTLRPDLDRLRLGLRQQNIQIRYLKNQLFPVLDLVGSYGQSARRSTGYDDVFKDIGAGANPDHRIGRRGGLGCRDRRLGCGKNGIGGGRGHRIGQVQ